MNKNRIHISYSCKAWVIGIGLVVGLMLAIGGSASAGDQPKLFKICNGKNANGTLVPHALCATASCFVFNGLAYCKCDVAEGDSISLPFEFGERWPGLVSSGQDICTVNADGVDNGYMASTYSFPPRCSKQAAIRRS